MVNVNKQGQRFRSVAGGAGDAWWALEQREPPPASRAGCSQKHPRPLILTWPSHRAAWGLSFCNFFCCIWTCVIEPGVRVSTVAVAARRACIVHVLIRQITSRLGRNSRCVVCLRLRSARRRRLRPRLGGAPCYLANWAEIHSTV